MHVIVLGSGVIGTTTAYYLARQGVAVTVIDRASGPALETSFANAGQVSPGYSTPWAAPGIPLKALKWLFQKDAPLAIRPDGSLYQWRWMAQMLANCRADRYAVNKSRMLRLAEYSRDCLRGLRHDTGIRYDERTQGTIQLFRTQAQWKAVQRDIAVLQDYGVPFELLDPQGLVAAEPGLARATSPLVGGLRLPNDETGDCQMFTAALAAKAAELGARFRFGSNVSDILVENGLVRGVRLESDGGREPEVLQADCVVAALGSYTRKLLRPLGLDLPVYPVKGYSLTIALTQPAAAPVSTVLDESYKVAVTRFDNRIRVGGMAELAGYDLRLYPRRRRTLERVVNELYPDSGDVANASFWTGLRPMTPDSTPIVGRTPYRNLFLNTGHGTLGWTMACGSSQLLTDLILQRRPAISVEGLELSRYLPAGASLALADSVHIPL